MSRQQPGLACYECRRKKLRCDRRQPQCGFCQDSGIVCYVSQAPAQRGPKKGHLKALRSRIATLEGLLGRERTDLTPTDAQDDGEARQDASSDEDPAQATTQPRDPLVDDMNPDKHVQMTKSPLEGSLLKSSETPVEPEMSEIIRAELDQLYFDRVHPLAPIIHQGRYLSWARQNDKSRPRVCLQFAMWTLAASASAQFHNMRESLHACGRSNLEALDHNEQFVSDAALEAAQAWLLITHYELRYMQYQRAWITAGRAFRIVQISKLHQIDALNSTDMSLESEVWVECEEKRRTFWLAYCPDRFINFRNRGPLTLQEEVICTRLPAPESDFQHSRPVVMEFLSMTIASSGQNTLALFAEIIVLTTLCGRSLLSKQLPPTEDTYGRESSSNFWTRHKWLFQMVQKRLSLLSLPASSAELLDPMRLFTNMLANAAVIWLWDVMEMQSWDKDKQLFFAPADVYSALQSACEIADLAKTLKRSNFLKAHWYSPAIIFLAAKFFRTHSSVPGLLPWIADDRQAQVEELTQALQVLGNGTNNLAVFYLQLLESDSCGDPCKLSLVPLTTLNEHTEQSDQPIFLNGMDSSYPLDGQMDTLQF